MFTWFSAVLRLPALPRRSELGDRAAVLVLLARCVDEICSGLLVVLMPTLQARLRLSVRQVAWCFQALGSVAALVEPVAGAAIDVARRRPLLVWGATGWGVSLLVAAGAGSYGWLLLAFMVAGTASGPLAHTADVVLVEAHPQAVERIASRSTWLDTTGALSAPAAVALAAWSGANPRGLLVVAGGGTLLYAAMLAGTVVPAPVRRDGQARLAAMVANVVEVLRDRRARGWLLALLLFELLAPAEMFEPVWLASTVGASQAVIGAHAVVGLAADLVALVFLDRWLAHRRAEPVLVACSLASLVLYPAWLLVPGIAAKFLLVVPRNGVLAPLWPILRSRALAALPGRGGATSAVLSLLGLVPLHLLVGWLAARVGLTRALLGVVVAVLLGMLAMSATLANVQRAPAD